MTTEPLSADRLFDGTVFRVVVFSCSAMLAGPGTTSAQTVPVTVGEHGGIVTTLAQLPGAIGQAVAEDKGKRIDSEDARQQPFDWPAERRACEGCPRRSVGRALLQTTLINVLYETANLARGQVTARITPKTWWDNMANGWVWDLDDFMVNQIGHPYQGNNYFTSGRANGLSFYESAALTAFGSGTWEYFGETNFPSVNDFINTTLGGIALGEMFHRAGWLVRDTHATGRRRLWREIGAMAFDPLTGYNRFRTGDAKRISDKPADMVPSSLAGFTSAGVLWRGTETRAVDATGQPFLELDLLYGDPQSGRSRTPYDAFGVRLRFGGGAGFSEARVRGRLLGEPLGGGNMQFTVGQSYDYQSNDAYATGAQSIDAALGVTHRFTPRTDMWLMGWGGVTVLGAVDSLPLGITERPPAPEPGPGGGQGVSEGPRFYDYGPGSTFGALAQFARNGRLFAAVLYEGRETSVLARRCSGQPLPSARPPGSAVPAARRDRSWRIGGVLLSAKLLPGRGSLAAGVPISPVPRVLHLEHRVNRSSRLVLSSGLLVGWFLPSVVVAQSQPTAGRPTEPIEQTAISRLWLTAGTASATLRGDCQTCEEDFPYRHGVGVLGNIGYRVNEQMDVGAEIFWMPVDTAQGQIRTTHLDAVALFRPWASKGFFLKGGSGMAFVRNWLDAVGPESINQKALSVIIGAGWAFRPAHRVGFQVFGAQHVAALGDFQTAADEDIEDVVGNFWSLGIAIVIR